MMAGGSWLAAYWVLSACFLLTMGLNLAHVRGGFATNYLADLVVPAWLYVVIRGLAPGRRAAFFVPRWIGRTPERAAGVLFLASAASEWSQIRWPHGFFAGRFDPLDLVAYAAGLLACYAADKRAAGIRPHGEARNS